MAHLPHLSLPPASAEYLTTLQLAQAGAGPQQSASQMFRASDGKMRVDYGNTSVITNPAERKTILLNHLAKEARIVPTPPQEATPRAGQVPPIPGGLPVPDFPMPAVNVKDLGKRLLDGHEVEGKQYTFQPPQVTLPGAPPAPPQPGALPQAHLPKLPNLPQAPQLPPLPPLPHTVTEVWTSTKLHVPMLTKMTGAFGERTSQCRRAVPGEPDPSLFQIPPGYKLV